MSSEKRTPLYARHEALGARMTDFAGYQMPIQYAGIKAEHACVRRGVGVFDVSHMGEVEVVGAEASQVVDSLVTNDASSLSDGQAMYTVMCRPDGGIIDDMVIYRLAGDHFLMCVNASRKAHDFEFMQQHARGRADLVDRSDEYAQLAVQGPRAEELLDPLCDADLSSVGIFRSRYAEVHGVRCLIARTGYTGEDGFELYIPAQRGVEVFDAILEAGAPLEVQPCGLGARDTLRLEARLPLYGQDLHEGTNPYEAGLGWVVKLDKSIRPVGHEALRRIKTEGVARRLRGFILEGRGILRAGYSIFSSGQRVGELTSGGYSPTLGKSIGLGYLDAAFADEGQVDVDIRGRRVAACVTKKPFYRRD